MGHPSARLRAGAPPGTLQLDVLLLTRHLTWLCRHRAVYYLQAVLRCEIDKQSWPLEVKVQEEVFVSAPVPPDYLCPLKASSVWRSRFSSSH